MLLKQVNFFFLYIYLSFLRFFKTDGNFSNSLTPNELFIYLFENV